MHPGTKLKASLSLFFHARTLLNMPTISETAAAAMIAAEEELLPVQEARNEVHIEDEGQDVGSTGQPKEDENTEATNDTPASPTDSEMQSNKSIHVLTPLPGVETDAEVALLNELIKQIVAACGATEADEKVSEKDQVEKPESDLASDDYIDEFVKDVIDGSNDIEYQDIYDSNYTPKYVKIIRKGPVQITVSNNKIPTSTLLVLLLLQPAIYAIVYAFLTR
jgi:hypothetical protein